MTKHLIDILNGKRLRNSEAELIEPLIELASKNKVLLQLLIDLGVEGFLREWQEKALRETVRTVEMLSKSLSGHDYVFFKLVKPVSYVPADIDVLVKLEEVGEIIRKIVGLGYEVVVKDPLFHNPRQEGGDN